jgi:hypothetical protein
MKTEFVSHAILIKIYFMWSEIQPGVRRAQKREIQVSCVTNLLIKNVYQV